MASIAESSVGSLPTAKLALLQEHFLQGAGRVPPEATVGNESDGANSTTLTNDGGNGVDGEIVIEESANAYRTPNSSPKIDALSAPRLESAKSAPTAQMEAMVNPSPSQEAFEGLTRASSFHGFNVGDTQPNESQIYREFHDDLVRSKTADATTPRKEKVVMHISPSGQVAEYTYDTNVTAATPRTLQEGDAGYVDLANGWDPAPGSPTAGSESYVDDLINDESPVAQSPEKEVFRKPAMPETPAIAGHKRRRSGEVVTSEPSGKKTPRFSQLFGFRPNKGDTMTGTQLFEQTQQPSSPVPDAPRSDPVITRPSPNPHNSHMVSSPTVMMSSPVYNRATPAVAGEPRETYTSMLESQERKRSRLQEEYGLKRMRGDLFDDFWEDEEDPHRQRIAKQNLRRAHSDHTLDQLTKVRAPSRPGSRPATSSSPRKAAFIDLRTPATRKKGDCVEFDVSDDGGGSDDEPIVEGEGIADDEHTNELPDDDEQSENDVYDEYGQTVLRSQGPGPDDADDEPVQDDENVEVEILPGAGKEATAVEQPVPQRTLVQDSSQQDRIPQHRRSQTATQHSAIQDSQPFRTGIEGSWKPQHGNDRSPSCSYVPGSQYAGKTSQDRAQQMSKPAASKMGPPALSTSKSQDNQHTVPSSPPLPVTNRTEVDYTSNAPLERRTISAQYQPDEKGPEQLAESEIPESDIPTTDHGSSRPGTAEDRWNTDSNNAPYSTARSQLSTRLSPIKTAPPPSPLKLFASQQSKANSQSPRTKAGVRRFADIAGDASPPRGSGQTEIDVDAVMSGFMNAEDQRFLCATSSPPCERPQKRRRTAQKPSIRSSSPIKELQIDAQQSAAAETLVAAEAPVEQVAAEVPSTKGHTIAEPQVQTDGLDTRALRNSPSKANEQRAQSPPPDSTPESVKLREQAGANAASRLLSRRASKMTKPSKLSGNGRKANSKLQHEKNATKDGKVPVKKSRTKRASKAETGPLGHDEVTKAVSPLDPAAEPEIEETVMESRAEEQSADQHHQRDTVDVVAAHRVFALFKGTFNMFYTATWLGTSASGSHRVKFDDGTVTSVDAHLVGRLEISLGDQVKVDYQGMKNKVWIVKGFGSPMPPMTASEALTDIHGHDTVKVQAKSTRNSVSGPNAIVRGEGKIFDVAIEVVYLTHSMWTHFSSRHFQPGSSYGAAARHATPSTGVQTPIDTETPTSRSRRALHSTSKALEKRGAYFHEESITMSRMPTAGLFHGMAFAVSYGQTEKEKGNVIRLVQRNGGIILDDGFEGLFDAPSLDEIEAVTSPKKSARNDVGSDNEKPGLRLKPEHHKLGFVALIADKHSRRAKYIQALALGIPALSGRWVVDCLDTLKNTSLTGSHAAPLPWTKYLLAAGESSYLNGAIRSREIMAYEAASARLDDTVARRPLLLSGDGVLIVASKKSKATWERRKAFAFLTLALGAGHVKRVSDLQEAKSMASEDHGKWTFIYVDSFVAEASAAVFGKSDAGGDKKRKREDLSVDAKAVSASDGRVKIVNDEFVVQSLILGALVD